MNKRKRELGRLLLLSMIGAENSQPIGELLASLEQCNDSNLSKQEQKEAKNDENSPL